MQTMMSRPLTNRIEMAVNSQNGIFYYQKL